LLDRGVLFEPGLALSGDTCGKLRSGSSGAGLFHKSAQAAERGAKQFRNSSAAAAWSVSVVRGFLGSTRAAGRGANHRRNPPVQPRSGGHHLREFLRSAQAAERGAKPFRNFFRSRRAERVRCARVHWKNGRNGWLDRYQRVGPDRHAFVRARPASPRRPCRLVSMKARALRISNGCVVGSATGR
jgi:hypothetical protein